MSLAVAELILSNPNDYRPVQFAASFLNAYKREFPYRTGYGSRVRLALTNSMSGIEFMNIAEPHQSSNGAIMRVLPCGLLGDPVQVQNAAVSQCLTTHIHHEAMDSARVLSLLVHSLIYNDEKYSFTKHFAWALKQCQFTSKHTMISKYKDFPNGIPCDSYATVGAVVDVVTRSNNYKEVLINSVAFGGDVDSVAALAMGIASLCPHIKKVFTDKKGVLFSNLENGPFGRDYCVELDKKITTFIELQKAETAIVLL